MLQPLHPAASVMVRNISLISGILLLDLLTGIESIQARHIDIKEDNVWLEFGHGIRQMTSVRDDAHYQELRFQEILACISHKLVIIGDQNTSSWSLFSHSRPPDMRFLGPDGAIVVRLDLYSSTLRDVKL